MRSPDQIAAEIEGLTTIRVVTDDGMAIRFDGLLTFHERARLLLAEAAAALRARPGRKDVERWLKILRDEAYGAGFEAAEWGGRIGKMSTAKLDARIADLLRDLGLGDGR